jgi:hypothetical protein
MFFIISFACFYMFKSLFHKTDKSENKESYDGATGNK